MNKLVPQNEQQEHLVQILLAKLQEVPVEFRSTVARNPQWRRSDDNKYMSWANTDYRIIQKSLTLPNEFWKYIDPKWHYIAMDRDGEFFMYDKKPDKNTIEGVWESSCYNDLTQIDLNIDTTGYEWYETLIERPEGV